MNRLKLFTLALLLFPAVSMGCETEGAYYKQYTECAVAKRTLETIEGCSETKMVRFIWSDGESTLEIQHVAGYGHGLMIERKDGEVTNVRQGIVYQLNQSGAADNYHPDAKAFIIRVMLLSPLTCRDDIEVPM